MRALSMRDWHGRIEERLKDSGTDFTMLRPNFFMQGVAALVGADGNIYAPTGDGRVGCVDVRDVAEVAARALTGEGHEGERVLAELLEEVRASTTGTR